MKTGDQELVEGVAHVAMGIGWWVVWFAYGAVIGAALAELVLRI